MRCVVTFTISAAVLVAGCGRSPAGPTGAPVAPRATAITGIITGVVPLPDSTGHPPVWGATVEILEGAGAGRTTVTDKSGRFSLDVPAGDYRLKVLSSNYLAWSSGPLTVADQQTLTVPTVLLKTAPWTVSGKVTDNAGLPFPGVQIKIRNCWYCTAGTVTTDAEGRYHFSSSAPHGGSLTFEISGTAVQVQPSSFDVGCCTNGAVVYDFRATRVTAVQLQGPSSIRVGDNRGVWGSLDIRVVR